LAIALFGGAIFKNKTIAYSVTLGSMFVADLFLGLHESLLAVYLCLALFVFIGTQVKRKNSKSITLSAISSSIIFFLVTNFSVWAFTTLYTQNLAGLMTSYSMAIPFLKWNLLSTLLYSGAMFGAYNLLEKYDFGFTQVVEIKSDK
jgi:signal transduction histidine kinase